ncbi:MAG: homoserine kinase [Cytophagales bacterium]
MSSIKVFAPATVANVVCGFDVLGFALHNPGDEVIIRKTNQSGVKIKSIQGDNGRLPLDPEKNTVGVSVINYLKHIGSDQGVEIELIKNMPLGSGLGSSSASTVAGVFAINELLGSPLKREELLPFAMEGERLACGSAHADNVAPALLGGFVLVRSYAPLDVVKLPTPKDMYCSVVHPHIEVQTKDARQILPKQIFLKDAVTQWGNVAGLVSGLYESNYELIGRSLKDVIVEPVRSILIPGFMQVKESALNAGAIGGGISGSGPSIFALCKSKETAIKVNEAMKSVFDRINIGSDSYISEVNSEGPRVIN